MSIPFRDEYCPARGPALSHMADYPSYVCVECGQQCVIEAVKLIDVKGVWKIAEVECIVDHASLEVGRVGTNISSKGSATGITWSMCPQCGVIIEPQHAIGIEAGPPWGIGRSGSPRAVAQYQTILDYMKWFYAEERHER